MSLKRSLCEIHRYVFENVHGDLVCCMSKQSSGISEMNQSVHIFLAFKRHCHLNIHLPWSYLLFHIDLQKVKFCHRQNHNLTCKSSTIILLRPSSTYDYQIKPTNEMTQISVGRITRELRFSQNQINTMSPMTFKCRSCILSILFSPLYAVLKSHLQYRLSQQNRNMAVNYVLKIWFVSF